MYILLLKCQLGTHILQYYLKTDGIDTKITSWLMKFYSCQIKRNPKFSRKKIWTLKIHISWTKSKYTFTTSNLIKSYVKIILVKYECIAILITETRWLFSWCLNW